MITRIRVRDHSQPCEHDEAAWDKYRRGWFCFHTEPVLQDGRKWDEYDCLGGQEIVLEHDDSLPTLGKLWCELPLSDEAQAYLDKMERERA